MLLLAFDTETTGIDVTKDSIIEVGAVIWCTEARAPKLMYNELVCWPNFTGLSEEIVELTGITPDDISDYGKSPAQVFSTLLDMMKSCNYIVAHNGNAFDRPMLASNLARLGMEEVQKHWIDTMLDVDYPPTCGTRKLTYLGAEHGFVQPFAHRALFDVLGMCRILDNYDIYKVLALSHEPMVTLQAICKAPWEDNGASTGVAKKNGFRWNGEKKSWEKQLKKSHAEKLQQSGVLPVREVL